MISLRAAFRKAGLPALAVASSLMLSAAAFAQDGDAPAMVDQTTPITQTDQGTGTGQNIPDSSSSLTAEQPDIQDRSDKSSSESSVSTLEVGPITFVSPWVLLGLGSLGIWFLMRSMPRKPELVTLPTVRFLEDLPDDEQTPKDMPWWQKLMRVTTLAMVITGMAGPEFNPDEPFDGNGPVVLAVDNDWASANNWSAVSAEMQDIIASAERDHRQIYILSTAAPDDDMPFHILGPMSAEDAKKQVQSVTPRPWGSDHIGAIDALDQIKTNADSPVFWLNNGLEDKGAKEFAEKLKELGSLTVIQQTPEDMPFLVMEPKIEGNYIITKVLRANTQGDRNLILTASDQGGNALAQEEVKFKSGEADAQVIFELPAEMRNQLAKISVENINTAGSVVLLDEKSRHRPVGVIRSDNTSSSQSLLNESTYVRSALSPHTNLYQGSVDDLLERSLSVMIMTDGVQLDEEQEDKIQQWVENGGTLLRFAGPRLAAQEDQDDELLPVQIREGDRTLGGGIARNKAATIAPFEEGSPFFGLETDDNIVIKRKVIAEPGLETEEKTWATLSDGTPFVTGARAGDGWVVLVHTTANTNWSNLPLSKLFIDMMRNVVAHSQGIAADVDEIGGSFEPIKLLDGLGQLSSQTGNAQALTKEDMQEGNIAPEHPPGIYGHGGIRYAHNLASAINVLDPLEKDELPDGTKLREFSKEGHEVDLKPALLAAALTIALADMLVLLGQQGQLSSSAFRRRRNTPALETDKKTPKPS